MPGESHGQRSLVGRSPWGLEGRTRPSDQTTKQPGVSETRVQLGGGGYQTSVSAAAINLLLSSALIFLIHLQILNIYGSIESKTRFAGEKAFWSLLSSSRDRDFSPLPQPIHFLKYVKACI
ncbi:unnamed protein product [Rangifer tarandus platyrhynchus]|uniref:Uncharacterized protein n=2 Tax=Rangifer tarandus platyrhynchus TaxID=3082113 RepID=A0ABN9A3V6_RANTA|nr:unnamed protein product [Rangifer tarandus platyrhynchus]